MPKNFYSGTQADLASGALNMVSILTPVPATYGVTAAQVTAYTALANSYNDLLQQATEPATRTPVVIENKNIAKKALRNATLNIAKIIDATPTVSNAQLLALRLNERISPTPRPAPETAPVVEVVSVTARLVKVRIHGAASEAGRKPEAARGAYIFSHVGPTAPTDPREYHNEGMATRATADILFPNSVPSGATVWLSACWVTARGQTSIASTPISVALQGGLISAAA